MGDRQWTVCGAAALALFLLGCHQPAAPPPAEAKPARVTLISPAKRSLTRVVEQPGVIQADEATALFARIPGYVGKIHTDIGRRVKAGEVLLELKVPELDEELTEKEARERQAVAEVLQARKALAAAEAMTAEAKAGVGRAEALADRWKSENDRVAALVGRGVIDQQTRDETVNQYKAARAGLEEAKARVTSAEAQAGKAEADVTAAQAKRDVAHAEVGKARAMVGYKKLVAPYDGIVTGREANEGDLIQTGRGHPLLTVARVAKVRAVIQVPEADAALVRDGADLTLTALGRVVPAKVARTSWALSPGARTLRVESDLPNPDGVLRPGTYLTGRLTAALPEAWTVPASAVARLGETVVAYRVEGGKLVQVPVEVGASDGAHVELRRWQKSASPAVWVAFTGEERVVEKAAGLFDGQPTERGGS